MKSVFFFLSAALLSLSFLITSCDDKPHAQPLMGRTYTGLLFGKPYFIDAIGDSANHTAGLDSIIRVFEAAFSMQDPGSILSRYNSFQRRDTVFSFVDTSMVFGIVYDLTNDYNRQTMGSYDPTTAPLKRAWAIASMQQQEGPNLDSLNVFVGFDGAKVDLNERYDDAGKYLNTEMRKSDPRIELDFTELAAAVALDHMADYLKARKTLQCRIKYERNVLCFGNAVDSIRVVSLGLTTETADQRIRLQNRAFTYRIGDDKAMMIDAVNRGPVANEIAYAGVSTPTMADAVVFSEVFMIMGLENIALYYNANAERDVQSFIFHQQDEQMMSSSTVGFDAMLVSSDAPVVQE